MNDSSAFDVLRAHGYEIAATSAGYENAVLRQADIFLDSGELNEFEDTLIQATPISWLLTLTGWDVIGDQQRSRTRHEFDLLKDLAATPSSRPRFAFVHVPAPHAPMVFGKAGAPVAVDLEAWYQVAPIAADERRALVETFRGGLEYLNGLVFDAIDDVIAAAPPGREPVIIVFSDSGSRWNLDDELSARLTERVSNFFAARTPGREGLFSDHITPVNVLPTLFDAYLGTDLPRSPDRNLITAGSNVFDSRTEESSNVDAQQDR